jgi:hypothetical protein
MVQADLAEFVHHHGGEGLVPQQVVEQGGLAAAEETGEESDGDQVRGRHGGSGFPKEESRILSTGGLADQNRQRACA